MEIPLRTAYSQAGRCGMQPKAKHSLRAQAQLMRTETVETFELVKVPENESLLIHEIMNERDTEEIPYNPQGHTIKMCEMLIAGETPTTTCR
ncbi:hypothetical protein TNCV_4407511 [Trichonephila clavipes]|nr:hypothetical protein TNCV_4407511 [Trichonephila clavipes]